MNAARFALGVVLASGAGVAAGAETGAEWKAGVASAVITPRTNMWMAGYAARKAPSHGTAQDLYAKALALEDEHGSRLVIVTMDLIGVLSSLRRSVETAVLERHGVEPPFLLMNASHTHCGPEYRERSGREAEARDYAAFLEERLLGVIGDALASMAPARLSHAHARCGFAMNRRRNYALPPDDPNAKKAPNPDGPVDHDVPVLMVHDAGTNLVAVLFGYACHNTTLSSVSMTDKEPRYEFNGDYAGFAQEMLQEGRPGLTAMFLNGCSADQNPYPRHYMIPYVQPLEFARHHGRTLAFSVEAAMASHVRPVRGPLRAALEPVTLDYAKPDRAGRPYPVQVIRFGPDIILAALGSEIVVDYSLRLKRELAGPAAVWIAGYSNEYAGYISSARVAREGGYEAQAGWDPSIEERIVGKVLELNDRLAR